MSCLSTKGMLFLSGFYQEDIPSIEGECRITSYNVCYTKLLRDTPHRVVQPTQADRSSQ